MVLLELLSPVIEWVSLSGYWGVFLFMVLESMVFPIPSELVMPLAGFLVQQGKMQFWTVSLVASMASVAGSLLSYEIGRYGGKPFIERYGKYFFLNQRHLDWTHAWFEKHGVSTIFVARLLPVVRHLISIPAGAAKMPLAPFVALTFAGALVWNTFLLWVGVQLGANWQSV